MNDQQKRALFQEKMNAGHSAAWDQDWNAAAKAYQEALAIIPGDPQALTNLGLAYYQMQEYEKALQAYEQAAQAAPNDPIPLEKSGELSERLGNLQKAVKYFMTAAELQIKLRNVEKALENWVRVTQIDPENAIAHSRLALAHERLGHKKQAAREYLALASLVQRRGDLNRTREMLKKALELDPQGEDTRNALRIVQEGGLLPKPSRPKGGTGPIRMAKVKQLEAPRHGSADAGHRNPVEAAAHHALRWLADIFFELSESEENTNLTSRTNLGRLMQSTGSLQSLERNRSRIILHLGQVIDNQTNGNYAQAAAELEAAIQNGFDHPAADFNLGYLRFQEGRLESAQRALQRTLDHADFGMASQLLRGKILAQSGKLKEAVEAFLQALKLADAQTVPEEQAPTLRALYDSVLDEIKSQEDREVLERIIQNAEAMLLTPDWQQKVRAARENLDQTHPEGLLPLTELIVASQSGRVLEALQHINRLARNGFLRSAMEEAYYAISFAPYYLPLHTLIGDMLMQENRLEDAIAKYKIIAASYRIRGESDLAARILRKITQISPMDLQARQELVNMLIRQNDYQSAIQEYLNLADFHYRLAELDRAMSTYHEALRLAQKHSKNNGISVHILERMADIEMQRLNWRQALRIYEQIRSIDSTHISAHRQIIDLNIRLAQIEKAENELKEALQALRKHLPQEEVLKFLEELGAEHKVLPFIQIALAEQYVLVGKKEAAISLLDSLAEYLLEQGQRETAIMVINRIIALEPPNVDQYRQVLQTL